MLVADVCTAPRRQAECSPALPAIHHFTDVENLEGIPAASGVGAHWTSHCDVDIADDAIEDRRACVNVPCGPDGRVPW
jgi:hypothetical protein